MANFVDWWVRVMYLRDARKLNDRALRVCEAVLSNLNLFEDEELQTLYLALSGVEGPVREVRRAVNDLQIERARSFREPGAS